MDYGMPGLPVPHHLPEFAQVNVHCIGDTIQASNLLMPSSPSALDLFQHQGLFQWVACTHQITKILELQLQHQVLPLNIQSWSPLRVTGLISLLSKGLSGVFSSTTVQRHQFFSVCLLYGTVLTTIHDHWEHQSLDNTYLFWQSNVSAFQHTV